ncbi:pitrilysin family protein [Proteiniclasticum sp.]|uniref:M16 family metallopeptidase n=1 Tax=Proteiniclasticum sp. TaxID=2053595 RepID=UPI00289B3377|nr:pitrilysin family protein [Proteiniclasticum sp.]
MIDFKQTLLNNGISLVTVKKPGELFSLNLAVKVGSLAESQKEKGICHFIEHMLFKGTDFDDNVSLNNRIERLGGDFNAYTDYISTVFSISALTEELDNGMSILRDMLIFPKFSGDDLEKEKGVILSELRASLDDAEEITHKNLYFNAYASSPLKYDVIGNEKTIACFTSDMLRDFHRKYYLPNHTILVLVSDLEHDEAIQKVDKVFGTWKKETDKPIELVFEKNIPGKHTSYKDMEQSSLGILYTFSMTEKEKLPLRILNYKLGVSGNSILFRELRENRGLAYDIYSDLDLTENIQNFLIYTQVPDESLDEAEDVILGILNEVKEGKYFRTDDLVIMKKVLKTSIFGTLDNIHDLSAFILDEMLNHEKPAMFEKDIEKLNEVTLDDIISVSRKVFTGPTIYRLRGVSDEDDHPDQ